jgi:hypothetical protein
VAGRLSRWFRASEKAGAAVGRRVVFFNSEIKKKLKKLYQLFVLARHSSPNVRRDVKEPSSRAEWAYF